MDGSWNGHQQGFGPAQMPYVCETGFGGGVPYGDGSMMQAMGMAKGGGFKGASSKGTPFVPAPRQDDGSDDETPSRLGMEATAEEVEEAQKVVQKAFKDAAERKILQKQAKVASKEDLQAMLNARLKRSMA
ncbi:unnamed protein product [Polarella glacialis]|uniref:Uncharacterized protein n=1 Tax=Polarella glacialis TaxID=89957 RepID=A0A813ITR3_POLGL|nr:unnamed protein product [Polarella glacialis]CAE8656689.1 unnamed protein product [Polarella glacialis]